MNTSNVIISAEFGGISATANILSSGQYLNLEENHIMCNKQLTLSFRKDTFSDEDTIRLGHGENLFATSFLELTKNDIKIYECTNEVKLLAERAHGLTLKDCVNISIDVGYSSARVTVSTASGVYQSGLIERCWHGRNGQIFAMSKNSAITDVKMRWQCSDYEKDIWLFGDSYFNTMSPFRWTYYLLADGYTQYLLSGYPGRCTASALADFKLALTRGKPKHAVWCMGMNDEDSNTAINERWLSSTKEFLEICSENEIQPILSTIPCVPERNHTFKNEWIKSLGLKYIDFARAVGGEKAGSHWYEGMLFSDNVHPDILGAKALYTQVITDFPNIMKR